MKKTNCIGSGRLKRNRPKSPKYKAKWKMRGWYCKKLKRYVK